MSFLTSPAFRKAFTDPARTFVPFPARALFLSTFRWISFGEFQIAFDSARVAHTVLMRGSNQIPSG